MSSSSNLTTVRTLVFSARNLGLYVALWCREKVVRLCTICSFFEEEEEVGAYALIHAKLSCSSHHMHCLFPHTYHSWWQHTSGKSVVMIHDDSMGCYYQKQFFLNLQLICVQDMFEVLPCIFVCTRDAFSMWKHSQRAVEHTEYSLVCEMKIQSVFDCS